MILQKQFHGFSVHNEFIFDSHFSAIAMELMWISTFLGGLVASEDLFLTMLESAMLSSNLEIIQRMVSDLESPAKYSIVHDFVMTWDERRSDTARNDASHVRDVQRARHVCGDPGWFVFVRYKTHNGHRDRFVPRCVTHSFPSTKRREAVSLRVETYRTEVGSLMAYVITFALRSTKRYLLAAFSDASFSPRRVTSHSPTSWAPSCSKRSTRTSPKS